MAFGYQTGADNSVGKFLLDAFDGVLGSEGETPQARRASFISANMLAGGIGLVCWPLHWVFLGPTDFLVTCAFVFLWAPLFIGLAVRLGWSLEDGQSASAFSLCGFVTAIALLTGGVASPAMPWLLLVPLEAALSGRRPALVRAAGLSIVAFLLLASLSLTGWLPASRLPEGLAGMVSAASVFAALVVAMLALRAFQRRTEQDRVSLVDHTAFLRSTTSASADLLTRHAADGSVLFCSQSSVKLLGMKPASLLGLSPAMFVHIQDLKPLELGFERTLSQGPQTIEVRLRRRDGSYVAVEMKTVALRGEIVASSRDVSDRNARIADLVIARDRAEQSSEARTRFLASVAHELRTPLNAIIGFSDMMHNEVFGPVGHKKYREYAEHIRDSGMHLVELVSDLLDMSKIEAGKFTIERQRVEIAPLLEECVTMLSGTAAEAGVNLRCESERGVYLQADRRAVKQAVVNLLSNAIKFTPSEGSVVLSAAATGDGVCINVADTGVGIPDSEIGRIGKPFEQVAGTKGLHKGTGLGLSLVKALTELHGGRMEITSALGDGTTVSLRLPVTGPDVASEPDGNLVFPERFRARA
jgi:cell cycle sensor histidine kinase DivJ